MTSILLDFPHMTMTAPTKNTVATKNALWGDDKLLGFMAKLRSGEGSCWGTKMYIGDIWNPTQLHGELYYPVISKKNIRYKTPGIPS